MRSLATLTLLALLTLLVLITSVAPASRASVAAPDTSPRVSVLLVPGLSGCAHGWRKVAPLLAAGGCRVVIAEPLGIGGAPRPADADYSLTAQADRLAARLDSLRAAPAVVVAHGVSVSMALRLAVRRPDLVRAVVALEGGPAETAASPALASALGKAKLAAKLLGMRTVRAKFRASLAAASGDAAWIDDAVVRAYLAGPGVDLGAAQRTARAMALAREPEPLVANLPRVRCPVALLLGGAPHAGRVPEEQVAALRAGVARLTVAVVDGAGHFLQEERPEVVASAALALAATSGALPAAPSAPAAAADTAAAVTVAAVTGPADAAGPPAGGLAEGR